MKRQKNQPNWSFIIQVSTEDGKWLAIKQVDQCVPSLGEERSHQRIRDQVETRLNWESKQTGHSYDVIYEGRPERAAAIMRSEQEGDY